MTLYHHSMGAGPDLVMLHGWGLHSGIWSGSENNLAAQLAQHYRVTMIDLPGHGLSNAAGEDFSFETAVDAIAALLPPTTRLLGWSLGGLLALQLARQLPQQITRLVLLAGTARFTRSNDWPAAMPPSSLGDFGAALVEDQQATVQRFLALQVRGSDNERQQLRLLKQTLAKRPAASRQALVSGLDMLASVDLRPQLPHIGQPALLLYGQHDRIAPAASGKLMTQIMPQAHSLTIAGAGHAPFLSHPQQTGLAIMDFLND